MKRTSEILKDIMITLAILCGCFGLCLVIHYIYNVHTLIPAIFVMGVFLVSVITNGYLYGIIASLISVMAVNFAFTSPFFAFKPVKLVYDFIEISNLRGV